MFYVAKQQGSP
jgi:hypothetical protein